MDLIDLGLIAAVGFICGTAGQLTSSHSRGGWIVNIVMGITGAGMGVYLSHQIGAPEILNLKFGNTNFPIVFSLVGSVLMVGFIGFLVKPKRH